MSPCNYLAVPRLHVIVGERYTLRTPCGAQDVFRVQGADYAAEGEAVSGEHSGRRLRVSHADRLQAEHICVTIEKHDVSRFVLMLFHFGWRSEVF